MLHSTGEQLRVKCLAQGHSDSAVGLNPQPPDWKTDLLTTTVTRHTHNDISACMLFYYKNYITLH